MFISTLTGNIGNDAETRYSSDGKPQLRFNVASNYQERNQQGEYEQRVEWIRCTIFGPRAEKLGQYLTKGTRVTVVGQVKARPWTGSDGTLHAGLEILVSEIDFSGSRENGNGHAERPSGQPARPRPAANESAAMSDAALPF